MHGKGGRDVMGMWKKGMNECASVNAECAPVPDRRRSVSQSFRYGNTLRSSVV